MSYRLIDNETNEDIIDKLGRIKDERDKYKEVLDKIKVMFKKEHHEDGCEFCNKLEKLLEDLDGNSIL